MNDTVGVITGLTTPVFSANSVTIEVFLGALGGDDGNVNAAAILGTPMGGATDMVPNEGHVVWAPAELTMKAGTVKSDGFTRNLMPSREGVWLEGHLLQFRRRRND